MGGALEDADKRTEMLKKEMEQKKQQEQMKQAKEKADKAQKESSDGQGSWI